MADYRSEPYDGVWDIITLGNNGDTDIKPLDGETWQITHLFYENDLKIEFVTFDVNDNLNKKVTLDNSITGSGWIAISSGFPLENNRASSTEGSCALRLTDTSGNGQNVGYVGKRTLYKGN